MTRTYYVYHLFRRGDVFDPVRDLLLTPEVALTWRAQAQKRPQGTGRFAVANLRDGKWKIVITSTSTFRGDKLKIERWLADQMLPKGTLGWWRRSSHRGLFCTLPRDADYDLVRWRLEHYNSLIKSPEWPLHVPVLGRTILGTYLEFTDDFQVNYFRHPPELHPKTYWNWIRPQLLERVQLVQDRRLGLTT